MTWWRDLSDDELAARLVQHGDMLAGDAASMVRDRDEPEVDGVIGRVLA